VGSVHASRTVSSGAGLRGETAETGGQRQGRRPRAEPRGAPTDQRRRASAGRILAVGLVCFLVWLLFDANQLYRSAQAGQIGIRRTVAVSILRPIAALTNALRISGPINAANTALGRCGAAGGSVCGVGPTVPPVTLPPPPQPSPQGYDGRFAAPHLAGGGYYVPPPVHHQGLPPIPSPTAAQPLTLLSIGDSVGEDLGMGLGDAFSNDPAVHVIQKGVESTGLSRSDYYNWPGALQADLEKYHPRIVVVMLGANDAQAFYQNGGWLSFGTSAWWTAYSNRVALVMDEATAAGARVMWVGLPPLGPASTVPAGFPKQVSKVFAQQAASHPGVTYFSAAKILSSKSGGFTQYLQINGSLEQIRYPDGVHLAPAGYDLLGRALIQPMQQAWHVNLRVG
jgi:uncharacterized protein